jgi:glycosyltransferase involved in cell wall biosynthesis
MKVSVITVTFNSLQTVEDCILSVLSQTHRDTEHIIIDGGSDDGTVEVIKRYEGKIGRAVSESDRGIYDAMNKGISLATGDIIGILNSDDVYAGDSVLEEVAETISRGFDSCYGDLVYVDRKNTDTVVRFWKAGRFCRQKIERGWMPGHPTFFARKTLYEKHGNFNIDFPIVADYELMLRFLYKYKVATGYIPKVLVKMRTGGKSRPSIRNTIRNNLACYRAWSVNGLRPNPLISVLKPLSKAVQYIRKK